MEKVSFKIFGIIFITTLITTVSYAEYDELCARVVDGMKMREPGNCQAFITCKNGTGTLTTCPEGQVYDKNKKKCDKSTDDSYCKEKCKNKNGRWLADPANCNGYVYCESGKGIKGTCTVGYVFDEAAQLCVFPEDSDCKDISDFCGILPSSTSFSDPDNCNKYYKCSKSSVEKLTTCGNGLYYDVSKAECRSTFEVPCKRHPIPKNICGKDAKPIYNKYVNDGISCQGYYYCAYKGKKLSDKKPSWYKCNDGLFFDAKTQSCNDPAEVQCKHNRCEGRGDMKVISEIWGCRDYIVCNNGLVKETRKCPKDMFFDEKLQACTLNETFYAACDY